jgi:glycosyltransferase involved in cell wall biosynthesis
MKICFVGTFPPSGRQLNEYAFHIARELQKDPLLSLTILSDELEKPEPELSGFDVVRCWRFDDLTNPFRILRAIRKIKPDVVWFNLVFSSFGTQYSPVAAFVGLCTPALTRLSGYYTHITLHHLMEHVDFSHANIRQERLFRIASSITTRILLMANSLSVLLPGYRRTLIDKYRGEDVHFRAHGIFSTPEPPAFDRRGNPHQTILAIGHWGTYKRLELLMEAFSKIAERVPDARLVIAGANHHTKPGYWESIAEQYKGDPRIDFKGYVAEDDIPDLFSTSSLLVMPYSSSTGASGPAHQACEFGLPVVCADIADFREMADYEGMAMDFYTTGDVQDFADKVVGILESPERQRQMAEQNFSAGLRMTMPEVMHRYLRTFDFHRRAKLLASISRFRILPGWVHSRSAAFRSASADFIHWG